MSMLAERRVKQKWSLNPRGKDWSEDSCKFGQKMLEKMGWSKGKGLGAKEDGIVEHLRVAYKNDSKGMGFKDRNDQWTEHASNYNALLQSLSGETPQDTLKISSLEKKSQSSRVRVHYKKFTRGKDLSSRSEKDLANIFGKRSLKEGPADLPTRVQKPEESVSDSFTHNGGSMVDYFKKKLPNFGKTNAYVVGSNGVLQGPSDSEERVGLGFEKKRKSEEVVEVTPKRRKEEDEGLSNPAFDPMFGSVEVQRHVLNAIKEENEDECQSYDKKVKRKGELEVDSTSFVTPTLNGDGELKRKKKKKREDVKDVSEIVSDSLVSNGSSEGAFEVKRKKKKKKHLEIDNPNFEDGPECVTRTPVLTGDAFEVKRKKKKKSRELEIDNPNFQDSCEEGVETPIANEECENAFEVKRKKKKKRDLEIVNPSFEDSPDKKNKVLEIDNPSFVDSAESSEVFSTPCHSNFEVKRKKKKNLEIDNPSFRDSPEDKPDEPVLDLILNVTSTPCPPKPTSNKRRKSVRFSKVNEERIIPSIDDENRNELFDINSKVIAEGLKDLSEMSKKIDGLEAEVENDINEAKVTKFIGEVGNPEGENEKLPEGTRLKFKYAKFGRSQMYGNKSTSRAKASYKHLIKGDIVLEFKNTNLHEIVGYGVKK